MAEQINEKRINPWPWIGTGALLAGLCVVGNMLDGHEHGASKTNVDTMPSYAVAPLVPHVTEAAPALPKHAKTTGMAVCANSIFLDWQAKQVIIRPVLRTPGSGRPLELTGVDAGGAHFTNEQPRDNFGILRTDGTEDNDQRLTADECGEEGVRPVRISGRDQKYGLVPEGSDAKNGYKVGPDAMDAVCSDLVHVQVEFPSTGAMDAFVTDLQGQA
jgi:hypothetical protein